MLVLFNFLVWVATIVSLVLHEAAKRESVPIEVGIYLSITASCCLAGYWMNIIALLLGAYYYVVFGCILLRCYWMNYVFLHCSRLCRLLRVGPGRGGSAESTGDSVRVRGPLHQPSNHLVLASKR